MEDQGSFMNGWRAAKETPYDLMIEDNNCDSS